MKTIIAVDPGANGGIAWHDGKEVHAKAMPDTRRDCINLVKEIVLKNGMNPVVAYHEKITGFIPDGGASMMFQFGASCERVACILETLDVRTIDITPQAWQKRLGLGNKGLTKAPKGASDEERKAVKAHNAAAKRDWKTKLKERAQRLFPTCTVTLRTADALLILEAAMQAEGGGQVIQHGAIRQPSLPPSPGDELPFAT